MKLHILSAILGFICLSLSGCSTTTLAYYNTLKLALKDRTVTYTVEEIAASKADLMQIKAGERDGASLALAYNPLATNNVLPFNWKRKVDIATIGYGIPVDSSWRIEGEETREYLGYSVPVIKVVERVSFSEYTPFIDVGLSWENTYFLHKYSKELLASKQQFSPEGDVYDMVYLSRIVREMNKQGATQ